MNQELSTSTADRDPRRLKLTLGDRSVSALLLTPPNPRALYIVAHGAGAGMEHPFITAISRELGERGIATLRFNFPYMDGPRRRLDAKPVLHSSVRAAVTLGTAELPEVPIIAGGKSMGGRMTSAAQAEEPMPGVRGLVFLGFPLHPPKRLGTERADHLDQVDVPSLFLQGTRDTLADLELMGEVTAKLGRRATLHVVDGADHGFHVLKRSSRSDSEVIEELADTIADWLPAAIDS
ncbi:MAG: alpha/beta hydrolase [Gemmatimonas sp.]|nr:alpha/beta hydrolase [Gemmatimonas sp.]